MFPLVHKIQEMCRPWNILVSAETSHESQQTCKNQDTAWTGYNNEGEYNTENDDLALLRGGPDPNNGHK